MENVGAMLGFWVRVTRKFSHFAENTSIIVKKWASTKISLALFPVLFVGSLFYLGHISAIPGSFLHERIFDYKNSHESFDNQATPIKCTAQNLTQSCPLDFLQPSKTPEVSDGECPEYFRWIHSDLQPWKQSGITRETLERGKEKANFRLVIIKGKAYVEKYKASFQTRDVFTIWGILQLLRLYPGKVPDLELLFACGDRPRILRYLYQGPNATLPPPLFNYCGEKYSMDIVFPDWTFWGWPEINIKPWNHISEEIIEGNEKINWKNRLPYAYWKGNQNVSLNRRDLMKCNASDKYQWNARLFVQDWRREIRESFKSSKLHDQCTYRYKIYVEGIAWSVSDKYILACDSMSLVIEPKYFDFFLRSLVPMQHYWPIRKTNKCRDIKFAVEWGNNHTRKAQEIGRQGSRFIQEKLKMKYVYDYMLHLLIEYAKLLKFEPKIPERAKEICSRKMACSQTGKSQEFMLDSVVNSASEILPCNMPSPVESHDLEAFLENNQMVKETVQMWENEYWEKINLNQEQEQEQEQKQ